MPVRALPLPRRCPVRQLAPVASARGRAGHRPGRRDPRHRHGRATALGAARRHGARPGVPARRRASPPAEALAFFRRALELARVEADLVACPSQDTLDDCVRQRVRRRIGSASCPGASRRSRPGPPRSSRVGRHLRPRPALRAVGRHRRAPQEPAGAARRLPARSTATGSSWCWSVPQGWHDRLDPHLAHGCGPGAPAGLRARRRPGGAVRRSRRSSACPACARASACRCSRPWPRARRS